MVLTPSSLYKLLLGHFGTQKWWPVDKAYHEKNDSDPRFEIMAGAILTQNTAWANVEKALNKLRLNNALTVQKIKEIKATELKNMIQPSGFFNQKTQRLKILSTYLYDNYTGNLEKFFYKELNEIREELLNLSGIGPETADSILLYAGDLPIFVVDAYTKRICKRLPLTTRGDTYDAIQRHFEKNLHRNFTEDEVVSIFKELHALIVVLAKTYCKKRPACDCCPLHKYCAFTKQLIEQSF